jgi:hypothetical protein
VAFFDAGVLELILARFEQPPARSCRVVGNVNHFRIRADPTRPIELDPGATVWLDVPAKSAVR